MLHKETVERSTFELLKTLMQDEKLNQFNLGGGTALALHIGHEKALIWIYSLHTLLMKGKNYQEKDNL